MKKIFIKLYAFIMACMGMFMVFLCVDIADGRRAHTETSPHFHANTDNGAFILVLLMTFLAFFAAVLIFYITSIGEEDKDYRKDFDKYDRTHFTLKRGGHMK